MVETITKGNERVFQTRCNKCWSILKFQFSDVVEHEFYEESYKIVGDDPHYKSSAIQCSECGNFIEIKLH